MTLHEKIEGERVYDPSTLHYQLPEYMLRHAERLRITPKELVHLVLYGRGKASLPVAVDASRKESLQFVPGHVWGVEPRKGSPGPRYRSDVMVIDKMLDKDSSHNRRLFSGDSGRMLFSLMEYTGHANASQYYVTSVLKTISPDNAITFKRSWMTDQMPFLLQEIYLCRPKFMMILGADTVKMLYGHQTRLTDVQGAVRELKFEPPGEEPFTVHAIASMRPEALVYERQTFQLKRVRQHYSQLRSLVEQKNFGVKYDTSNHVVIDNADDLKKYVRRVREDSAKFSQNLICIDCEWEGEHPQSYGAYLRCIQISGKVGNAVTIALTHPGGKPRFKVRNKHGNWTTKGGLKFVIKQLQALYVDRRPTGHSLKSDLEWLEYYGLDLSAQLYPPDNPEDCKTTGGFCTLLAAHAYDEQAELGLTEQIQVHLPHIPNYEAELEEYKKRFCHSQGISKSDLKGYGEFADEALYPYAGLDVDAGLQLALFYLKRLDKDQFGNKCWNAYHISYCAMFAAQEITTVGLTLDKKQADKLTNAFMKKRDELLAKIRQRYRWPDLNLDSPDQLRELLFGRRYNGKDDKRRLRPPGALSLNTWPVMTTGRYQKSWVDIQEAGEEYKYKPSTNKNVLGLLTLYGKDLPVRRYDEERGKWVIRRENLEEELAELREFRAVNQQLKGPLRPPTEPPADLEDWDEDEPYYEKGIPGHVCRDNKIRCTVLQIKETGRWSTIRPTLQNLSSAVDELLIKIFAEEYPGSVKSMIVSEPGWYLVPVDLGGAELRMTAVQSQDQKFIHATECLALPEENPNHIDIHSQIAVAAFKLPCKRAIKSEVEKGGFKHLRTGAKTVIFGKFYGQSIQSSVIAVKTRGTDTDFATLQAISDAFDSEYPDVADYFNAAMERVNIGYLATWAGRYRRFSDTSDKAKLAAMKREALNAPIQGGVADYVSKCCWEAVKYREQEKMRFQIVLQKHDELMFHVPADELFKFYHESAKWIMSDAVPFWAADFEGRRLPNTPDYKFFYDIEVCNVWGEKIKGDELARLITKPEVSKQVFKSQV